MRDGLARGPLERNPMTHDSVGLVAERRIVFIEGA